MASRLTLLVLLLVLICGNGNCFQEDVIKAILLSGGKSGGVDAYTSVEVYVPSTGHSCSLPTLPDERADHTMDSLYICGGVWSSTKTSCLHFSSGQWYTSHTLVEKRSYHSSWQTDQGLVLMGGGDTQFGYRPDTSEIVPTAGEQGGSSFAMQYDTSSACAIPDLTSDSLIITGGVYTMQVVSRYDLQGHVEDLPQLVVGRLNHGCGSYLRPDDTQVLLVAGGSADDHNFNLISSTEVLTTDSPAWAMATPLPWAVYGVKGITLGNNVFMTGGYGDDGAEDDILEWRDEEQDWVEVGKMQIARSNHALTTINLDDPALDHCF